MEIQLSEISAQLRCIDAKLQYSCTPLHNSDATQFSTNCRQLNYGDRKFKTLVQLHHNGVSQINSDKQQMCGAT
jgi:hypothetical protein